MTPEQLRREVEIEMGWVEQTIAHLVSLQSDLGSREPSVVEKTAAAAFLAQFYGGVENTLKRISRYAGVPIPAGETWHMELFRNFSRPAHKELPELLDDGLAQNLAPYRKFRHVVHHGYGFQLEWERLKQGIDGIQDVWQQFRSRVDEYLVSRH